MNIRLDFCIRAAREGSYYLAAFAVGAACNGFISAGCNEEYAPAPVPTPAPPSYSIDPAWEGPRMSPLCGDAGVCHPPAP